MKINRKIIPWIFLFYLFIFRNIIIKVFDGFKYFDELVAILFLILVMIDCIYNHRIKSGKMIFLWLGLAIFVTSGCVGSFIYRYQPFFSIALPDILLSIKFFLWFAGAFVLSENASIDKVINSLSKQADFVSIVLAVLSIVDIIFHVFNEMSDYKMGYRAVALYEGPSSLAYTAGVLLTIHIMSNRKKKVSIYMICDLFIMSVTLRFKALASVAVAILLFVIKYYKIKLKIWHYIMMVLLAIATAWQQISTYIIHATSNARTQLWLKSFIILKDHFPFGSGFGTYASYYSKVSYSPLYNMYGLSSVYGLSMEKGSFINDTFWPMVIGQTGLIGLIGYSLCLYTIYAFIKKVYKANNNYYYAGIFSMLFLMISSTSESAFLHWNSMFFAILLGVICQKANLIVKGNNR